MHKQVRATITDLNSSRTYVGKQCLATTYQLFRFSLPRYVTSSTFVLNRRACSVYNTNVTIFSDSGIIFREILEYAVLFYIFERIIYIYISFIFNQSSIPLYKSNKRASLSVALSIPRSSCGLIVERLRDGRINL